jgi:hypothetical protein
VRATALLKRAQQQLDDNTAAVAAGIRSSKQKRVAREDFQALLSEATKQVIICASAMLCYIHSRCLLPCALVCFAMRLSMQLDAASRMLSNLLESISYMHTLHASARQA